MWLVRNLYINARCLFDSNMIEFNIVSKHHESSITTHLYYPSLYNIIMIPFIKHCRVKPLETLYSGQSVVTQGPSSTKLT